MLDSLSARHVNHIEWVVKISSWLLARSVPKQLLFSPAEIVEALIWVSVWNAGKYLGCPVVFFYSNGFGNLVLSRLQNREQMDSI